MKPKVGSALTVTVRDTEKNLTDNYLERREP